MFYSSHNSPTYLHANLCPCRKQLFPQKLKLYLLETPSHRHIHAESHSLCFFPCECGFSLDARLLPSSQLRNKNSQTEWRDETPAVAARGDTVRPPSSRPGCREVRRAAGSLCTQTLQRQRSRRSLQHAELSRGASLSELEVSHRGSGTASEHKQAGNNGGRRRQAGGLRGRKRK